MSIRPAAVAGSFYPGTANALRAAVQRYLQDVAPAVSSVPPKALIVPHAGYMYSAPIAAYAYAQWAPLRNQVQRVVLLGPAHRVAVRGLAAPQVDEFATPLGTIPIDRDALARLSSAPQVTRSDLAHAQEHSLEVQLPFLQQVLGRFALVPLVVGDATTQQVAQVLTALWGGPETRVVISSDLSHYLPYDLARCVDEQTAQAIMACAEIADHHHACGATPINGLLEVARGRGLRVAQLDLRNSGDMAGDHRRVVGYGAWAFYEPEVVTAEEAPPIHAARGDALLALARGAIAHELGVGARPRIASDFLRAPGASFVTLRIDGQLRGCIGSLQAQRPLGEDIEHNARAAAFADPRFSPLSADELPRTHIEVSVLSAPQPMDVHSLADLLAQLRPHVDGLILSAGARRATFLPQVWEQLPAPRDFVAQLQQKAGLPVGSWPGDMQAARYTVESFAELEQ